MFLVIKANMELHFPEAGTMNYAGSVQVSTIFQYNILHYVIADKYYKLLDLIKRLQILQFK